MAFSEDNIINIESLDDSNYEVGNIGWFTWEQANDLIRNYYGEKIKVVNQIYFLFLNLYLEYINNESIILNN